INPEFEAKNEPITALQTEYMTALMKALPYERYFPDANGTLRVTYGQVRGYSPRDAVYYSPVSYLDGVIEKYIPGDYEFDVPQKLIDLYEAKDYGPYADANGKVPVCFLGTNHTTGGNSGSPTIDAHGNLIGLNFDRVWEGTMSDMYYDPEICRNIMVDLRYVLFIVDKYAGAKHLIDEMELVHPKKAKSKQKNKKN
ncbi:S46 family peptidase, partial [Xanthomarina gelatinilytica]|uniref:S46 family peptidase n=1 Tax=Xanthomarina gelatinilytica TaxID=1137281 RepID=UPI003AA84627